MIIAERSQKINPQYYKPETISDHNPTEAAVNS